jgi:hypothetical protein
MRRINFSQAKQATQFALIVELHYDGFGFGTSPEYWVWAQRYHHRDFIAALEFRAVKAIFPDFLAVIRPARLPEKPIYRKNPARK